MSKRPKRERAAKKPANKVTGSKASKVVITGDSYDDPIALVAGVPAINDAKGATDAAAADGGITVDKRDIAGNPPANDGEAADVVGNPPGEGGAADVKRNVVVDATDERNVVVDATDKGKTVRQLKEVAVASNKMLASCATEEDTLAYVAEKDVVASKNVAVAGSSAQDEGKVFASKTKVAATKKSQTGDSSIQAPDSNDDDDDDVEVIEKKLTAGEHRLLRGGKRRYDHRGVAVSSNTRVTKRSRKSVALSADDDISASEKTETSSEDDSAIDRNEADEGEDTDVSSATTDDQVSFVIVFMFHN